MGELCCANTSWMHSIRCPTHGQITLGYCTICEPVHERTQCDPHNDSGARLNAFIPSMIAHEASSKCQANAYCQCHSIDLLGLINFVDEAQHYVDSIGIVNYNCCSHWQSTLLFYFGFALVKTATNKNLTVQKAASSKSKG